ncbi:MAG: hypothetical protein NZ922_05335 [Candidatus Methanomethyliaceae archaeon]|nr:hypothetical protein [Candidatus Methanomethyliaceae archaeon]
MSLEKAKALSIVALLIWTLFFIAPIPLLITYEAFRSVNSIWFSLLIYSAMLMIILLRFPLKFEKKSQALRIMKYTTSLIIVILVTFGFINMLRMVNERKLIEIFLYSASFSTILTAIIILLAYIYTKSHYRTTEHYIKSIISNKPKKYFLDFSYIKGDEYAQGCNYYG